MKQFGSHLLNGDQFFKAPIKKGLLVHISTPSSAKGWAALLVEVADLLQEFAQVFDTLVGLPPFRGYKHYITLKE